jgi:N utilization substance protein B
MGSRREGREFALKALYSLDLNPMDSESGLRLFWQEQHAPAMIREFADELVAGVLANREHIDNLIREKSKNWSLPRMARVDLAILRLAVYELLFRQDIPKNVTINEAIEIAKKFGAEDSPSFINGVIDEIASSVSKE